MAKTLRPDFRLVKVKREKEDSGMYIEYIVRSTTKGVSSETYHKTEFPEVAHPRFINSIHQLDRFLMKVLNFNAIDVIRKSDQLSGAKQKAFNDVRHEIDGVLKNTLDKITVNGVTFSGEEKNHGMLIMGVIDTDQGTPVALNSPTIVFSKHVYNFEGELEQIANDIKEEAFCYIFENKVGEPKLPFPDEEESKPKKKKQLELTESSEEA